MATHTKKRAHWCLSLFSKFFFYRNRGRPTQQASHLWGITALLCAPAPRLVWGNSLFVLCVVKWIPDCLTQGQHSGLTFILCAYYRLLLKTNTKYLLATLIYMKMKSKSILLFYSIAKKFQSLKEYIMEFIMYRNCDAITFHFH